MLSTVLYYELAMKVPIPVGITVYLLTWGLGHLRCLVLTNTHVYRMFSTVSVFPVQISSVKIPIQRLYSVKHRPAFLLSYCVLQATFLYSIYHQRAGKTNLSHMRGGRFHAGNIPCPSVLICTGRLTLSLCVNLHGEADPVPLC